MSDPILIELPMPPSTNNLFLNVRGGRVLAPKYRMWRAAAEILARSQVRSRRIAGPYRLEVRLCRPDRRRRDASNYIKACEDLLVSLGITDDDSQCQFVSAEWVATGPQCLVIVSEAT
jgi:Holliday junction resolvase RusA-like endonuclease